MRDKLFIFGELSLNLLVHLLFFCILLGYGLYLCLSIYHLQVSVFNPETPQHQTPLPKFMESLCLCVWQEAQIIHMFFGFHEALMSLTLLFLL